MKSLLKLYTSTSTPPALLPTLLILSLPIPADFKTLIHLLPAHHSASAEVALGETLGRRDFKAFWSLASSHAGFAACSGLGGRIRASIVGQLKTLYTDIDEKTYLAYMGLTAFEECDDVEKVEGGKVYFVREKVEEVKVEGGGRVGVELHNIRAVM